MSAVDAARKYATLASQAAVEAQPDPQGSEDPQVLVQGEDETPEAYFARVAAAHGR